MSAPTYNNLVMSAGNVDVLVGPSLARTTTWTSEDFINPCGTGIDVVVDMTVVGTGSIAITIQGKDVVSGKVYTLLSTAGAAITTNSTNVYFCFPGAAVTANVSANRRLPRTWNILVTHNNANSATYSVGASVTK